MILIFRKTRLLLYLAVIVSKGTRSVLCSVFCLFVCLLFRVTAKRNFFSFSFFVLFFCFFQDRISLYSLGCPGLCSIDQVGLNLRDPPASASPVSPLGSQFCFVFCFYLSTPVAPRKGLPTQNDPVGRPPPLLLNF